MSSFPSAGFLRALAAFALVWGLGACADNPSIQGDPVANAAPDTDITATPPAVDRTTSRVTFFWNGHDPDGEVVGFEWRISDNGADGVVDPPDTLEVDLPWNYTTAHDSTFEVSADLDSFGVDLGNPDLDPNDIRFWQTHTFYVRAVDDEGRRDPTPAEQAFTATTLAPTVFVDIPTLRQSQSCQQAARVLSFGWRVSDPDANGEDPAFVRTILTPMHTPEGNCYTRSVFEAASPLRADNPLWTDWIPWGEEGSQSITYDRQPDGAKLVFAVQAMDRAGAVTPAFTWQQNLRHVQIGTSLIPELTIREPILGERTFSATGGTVAYEVIGGQDLNFTWEADASLYAGVIEGYQHGWNLVDPDDPNDPGWTGTWGVGPSFQMSTRSFASGQANLVVMARDNQGQLVRATIQISIIEIPERSEQRPLLIVDDFPDGTGSIGNDIFDAYADARWINTFRGFLQGFDANDLIDAEQRDYLVGLRRLVEYRSVIWFLSASTNTYFHRNLSPRSTPVINWLETYQEKAGNLMLVGPGAAFDTIERGTSFGSLFTWNFPIVFNTSAGPGFGFGTGTRPDGQPYNVGTTRWPYRGFCLETIDHVRPPIGDIFGEEGSRLRNIDCDGLHRALVHEEFFDSYPDARNRVRDLDPFVDRTNLLPQYQRQTEEVYNFNPTRRRVNIEPRACQTPMYTHRARRDENASNTHPANCPPENSTLSALDGGTNAVMSRVYSDGKPLRGSEDILWGFHPWGFEFTDVRDALQWVAERRWNLRE